MAPSWESWFSWSRFQRAVETSTHRFFRWTLLRRRAPPSDSQDSTPISASVAPLPSLSPRPTVVRAPSPSGQSNSPRDPVKAPGFSLMSAARGSCYARRALGRSGCGGGRFLPRVLLRYLPAAAGRAAERVSRAHQAQCQSGSGQHRYPDRCFTDDGAGGSQISNLDSLVKVCAGRIRTTVPLPGYNIQSLFRVLPQHTVALTCAKALELPQNGFLRGNQSCQTRMAQPPAAMECLTFSATASLHLRPS